MLTFKLALKNLLGAGTRTWLNVIILSLAYVIIIIFNGLEDGASQKARTESIRWEYGQGQLWHEAYDPYDPFTLPDAHGKLPATVNTNHWVPILITPGSIYPQGRMQTINLKGIPPGQNVLALPTTSLDTITNALPAMIGKRMAASTNLKPGDQVLIRWRDQNGTYDAREITIVNVFDSNVSDIDNGQVWLPLRELQEMTGLEEQATLWVAGEGFDPIEPDQWSFKSQDALLKNINALIEADRISGNIIFMLLLCMALLAIFDTQVLSIFRRQKEIGTLIALGMTRPQVVALFTVEGGANSLLATAIGSLYGIPLLIYMTHAGIPMPAAAEGTIAIAERIYPVYSTGLILGTIALVVISATVVSFLPSRKIAKMNPTLALKGKLQ